MENTIIVTICTLLLIAYVFTLTSNYTKIPSVIMLLILGWLVGFLSDVFLINIPDLGDLLPFLGTIGLILIVLEGSLELDLDRSKKPLIIKSSLISVFSTFAMAFALAGLFFYFDQGSFKSCLINAIPFCVISSAIAIPSSNHLSARNKEFIIYESSFSDIIGVIFFNFIVLNEQIGVISFVNFGVELIALFVISFVATLGLSYLLSRIEHHVKFVPIILLIVLIYSVSKIYHLPALLFILLFGLFLGNLDKVKQNRWIKKFGIDQLNVETTKFKDLVVEATFLVRTLFFLLFGYLLETVEIFNSETFVWAFGIVAFIIMLRSVLLKMIKLPQFPFLFIAPRGLITILLFFSITSKHLIPIVNKSLIIQTILLSVIFMMIGMMFYKSEKKKKEMRKVNAE